MRRMLHVLCFFLSGLIFVVWWIFWSRCWQDIIGYIVGNIYCTFCTDLMFFVVIIFVIKKSVDCYLTEIKWKMLSLLVNRQTWTCHITLQHHVNKPSCRLSKAQNDCFRRQICLFYQVRNSCPGLWHHVDNTWAPARNVVDIGSRSCAASSVVTAMQKWRLKLEDSWYKMLCWKPWCLLRQKSEFSQSRLDFSLFCLSQWVAEIGSKE